MKLSDSTKNTLQLIVSYLFIILFVYASVSKLLEFQEFQSQLQQSPLLAYFANEVSYSIIIIELLASVLLALEKYRKWGLYISFMLMVMFTDYIIIILNFTSFTPCSCGGVLESLGWTEHLIFNIVFIILSIIALYDRRVIKILVLLFVCGNLLIIILFLLSENEFKRNNAFVRKYIPQALEKIVEYELPSNSYYIAGVDDSMIYLGNVYAPLYLKAIDRNFKNEKDIKLSIEQYELPFKNVKIQIRPPYFFVADGTVPIIFRGKIGKWHGEIFAQNEAYFYQFVAIDSSNIIFSTANSKDGKTVLGKLKYLNGKPNVVLKDNILKSTGDGVFDRDGMLLFSQQDKKMLYVHYYRNQFVIADENLFFLMEGKTIDTISVAEMNVAHYNKQNAYKLGMVTMVSQTASVWGNDLYINSRRLGRNEKDEILRSASFIDLYDIEKNEYRHSFYIYHQPDRKLQEFKVSRDTIFTLVDNVLWMHRISPQLYNKN